MSAPMENMSDTKTVVESDDFCTVEATVTTGFEPVAREEAEEKLETTVTEGRGRISIKCPVEKVPQVLELGCVDNCRVVLTRVTDFRFTDDKTKNLERLRQLVGDVDWPAGLKVWGKIFSFKHPIASTPAVITTDFGEVTFPPPRPLKGDGKKKTKSGRWKKKRQERNDQPENRTETIVKQLENISDAAESIATDNIDKCDVSNEKNGSVKTAKAETGDDGDSKKPRVSLNPWDPLKPSFRVTCNRNGEGHLFDSMTAASNFGGAIYRYFGWNVKMKEFDIEVILNIEDQDVTVCIGLTKESLHRRNIGHFGPTTLRPTVACNMLRLCNIQCGDVVCDPMCGAGSIPIQAAITWPSSYNVCGEIAGKAIGRTKDNLHYMREKRQQNNKKPLIIDPVKWNVCNLPLRDHSVDVFITDLPFGLRMGSKLDNWKLYPGALLEMARVVRPVTGRVCLLTQDKKCMIKVLQPLAKYWRRTRTFGINLGGLAAGVYVLSRTTVPVSQGEQIDISATDTHVPEDITN